MPVSDKHPYYIKCQPKWSLVRDCCEGSQAVKQARNNTSNVSGTLESQQGSLYLPPPNPTDNSQENKHRYRAYVTRANFVNFTDSTKQAFVGMVFSKNPIIELPQQIAGMVEDVNGNGESVESTAKRTLDEQLKCGRQGLLVDYPEVQMGLTLAQTAQINPFFKFYQTEDVINWKTKVYNGKIMLCMVVLKECHEEPIDEFRTEKKDRYRVLMLNEDGYYIQRLYNEDDELLIIDEEGNTDIYPRKADGSLWTEIPFIFIGAINNDSEPDKAPLYDIAEVNIAHYRNSADYEESCFLVGQPTPVVAGLTQGWVDDNFKNGLEIGSRAVIPLPEGGSATLLQASPNQMPEQGMINKEKQMIQIGAKIITDSGQAETAEAAKIRFAGQNSKLATIVSNIEDAYKTAFEWALMFSGGDGDIVFKLNREFYDKAVDPQLIMAKIQLLDRQVISTADMRSYMRDANIIASDRTDEDIDDDLREVSPFA